VSSLVTVW